MTKGNLTGQLIFMHEGELLSLGTVWVPMHVVDDTLEVNLQAVKGQVESFLGHTIVLKR